MIATMRADLAAALDTVPGIQGSEYRPAAIKTGDAWPLLSQLERGEGLAFTGTWRVLVVLSSDERTASDQTDTLVPALVDALEPVAFVDSITPVQIQTSGGELFALQIILRSE